MANIKDQLKGGISAMFGEGAEIVPEKNPEEDVIESMVTERRTFMTGRKPKGEREELARDTDMRTSVIVNKQQWAIVREIALRECMTIKDVVFAMFQLGISLYEQKNGKVRVRKPSGTKELF